MTPATSATAKGKGRQPALNMWATVFLAVAATLGIPGCLGPNALNVTAYNETESPVSGTATIQFRNQDGEKLNETIPFALAPRELSYVVYQQANLPLGRGDQLRVSITLANGTTVTDTWSPWTGNTVLIILAPDEVTLNEGTAD